MYTLIVIYNQLKYTHFSKRKLKIDWKLAEDIYLNSINKIPGIK